VLALGLRGWVAPGVVLAISLMAALAARVTRRLAPIMLATLPLIASILLVNTFLYPNARDTIAVLGPFQPTWTGATVALQATLRVVAFGLSAGVFALTTPTDDLLVELERRGLGRRGTFVVGSALGAVPRTLARAREVIDAQRARGLETEGGLRSRAGGFVPLAGPVIFGALAEVEERTMALESRGFSAPAKRTLLRRLPDAGWQRVVRWTIALGSVGLLAASALGLVRVA